MAKTQLVTVSVIVPENAVDALYDYVANLHRAARDGAPVPRAPPEPTSSRTADQPDWRLEDVGLFRNGVSGQVHHQSEGDVPRMAKLEPGTTFSGDELAVAMRFKGGRHGVAGTLG